MRTVRFALVLALLSAANAPAYTILHSHVAAPSRFHDSVVRDANGNLYGTTTEGGLTSSGTVFRVNGDGTGFAVLHGFDASAGDGRFPDAALVLDGDGYLYGTTQLGGLFGKGTVYRVKTDGNGYQILHSFAGGTADGEQQQASSLALDGSGHLYGTTTLGGAANGGTIFTLATDGTGYQLLHSFAGAPDDGSQPYAEVLFDGVDTLYGTTYSGGASNAGCVFSIKTSGGAVTLLHSFAANEGVHPVAGLVPDGGTALFGITQGAGAPDFGAVYKVDKGGTGFTVLHTFSDSPSDGAVPNAKLLLDSGALFGTTLGGGSAANGTVFTLDTGGNGFHVVHSFAGGANDGSLPFAGVILAAGSLVGTTSSGGAADSGALYRVSKDGLTFEVLVSLRGAFSPEGLIPAGPLVSDGAGRLYGLTTNGGDGNAGTVFAVSTGGDGVDYQVLHSFSGGPGDGASPQDGLVLDGSGHLYGTTQLGGDSGGGTVFAIDTTGFNFHLLHSFAGGNNDGSAPTAGLVFDGSFNLYGTTTAGGSADGGTVFAIGTSGGDFHLLKSFAADSNAPRHPSTPLAIDGTGTLFGATELGGAAEAGTLFSLKTTGSDFTVLHTFSAGADDGGQPRGAPRLDGVGNLYGVTYFGGQVGGGLVYRMTTAGGGFQVLHTFVSGPYDALTPTSLVLRGTGELYGTAANGGRWGAGAVFGVKTDGSRFRLIRSFADDPKDGSMPLSVLLEGDVLYGTTYSGGSANFGTEFSLPRFAPGDVNADGAVAVSDVFALINYLFAGGPHPLGPADANGDGFVNVNDVFYLINYLFAGGAAPLS